jgi:type I restriction enzyme M protein
VVALGEIREKDYNLNVTMYVAPKNEIERVDITATWQELSGVERELAEVTGKIEEYLRALGYLRQ